MAVEGILNVLRCLDHDAVRLMGDKAEELFQSNDPDEVRYAANLREAVQVRLAELERPAPGRGYALESIEDALLGAAAQRGFEENDPLTRDLERLRNISNRG
jgi:hypothetical protein